MRSFFGFVLRGLDAIQGDILSAFVEDDIDLSGVGRLLALTNNNEANALACQHFEDEFGSAGVFQLPPTLSARSGGRFNLPQLGRMLFASAANFATLQAALEAAGQIKLTPLTEAFTWNDFRQRHGDGVMPLMAIYKGNVTVATVDFPLAPQAGGSLVCLFFPGVTAA